MSQTMETNRRTVYQESTCGEYAEAEQVKLSLCLFSFQFRENSQREKILQECMFAGTLSPVEIYILVYYQLHYSAAL